MSRTTAGRSPGAGPPAGEPAASGRPSPELAAFLSEFPEERLPIYAFVLQVSASLPAGARVYDVGAGEAPYRECFSHLDYVTVDWEHSVHPGARAASVISSAAALLLEDESSDAVLLTQVLEHVADPLRVLREVRRVLRPGGRAFLSVPFVWELHEMPHDYWRFTPTSLRWLCERAGLWEVEVTARNDCFSTLAQLLRISPGTMGWPDDGRHEERARVLEETRRLADVVAAWAPLDSRHILPLGWTVTARRPPAGVAGPPVDDRLRIAELEAELDRERARTAARTGRSVGGGRVRRLAGWAELAAPALRSAGRRTAAELERIRARRRRRR